MKKPFAASPNSLLEYIEKLLMKDTRLVMKDEFQANCLNYNEVIKLVDNCDETLMNCLIDENNKTGKLKDFFKVVGNTTIFKQKNFGDFLRFTSSNNSFSQFLGKEIGLYSGDKALSDINEVVLNFPFKDCVLEGGQTTEEGKDKYYIYNEEKECYEEQESPRKEIFYHEVLAHDEIDQLFERKAFANSTRYPKKGKQETVSFTRDAEFNKSRGLPEDTITDNMIIKGNNLLALHSLKEQFEGKVKLIYIDPPYNTGSDSFKYNDKFNHSTWLTFMRNRLQIAKELLAESGVIFVQCDDNEQAYLKVLMDEIFEAENFIQMIEIKMNEGAANEYQNPFMPKNCEYGLLFAKNYKQRKYKPIFVERSYDEAYRNIVINKNTEKNYKRWKVESLKKYLKEQNIDEKNITQFVIENADRIMQTISPKGPGQGLSKAMEESKNCDGWSVYERESKESIYTFKGRMVRFYDKNISINEKGKKVIMKELGSLWTDIPTTGIANEGGVTLKNAKKPEKLLFRIINMATDEKDIVLDYHLGSGTTAAVALKMGRQFIGIEQLDYGENDSVARLQNVVKGDQTGVSKLVNWDPTNKQKSSEEKYKRNNFVYLELAKKNERAKELINKCDSYDALKKLFKTLEQRYFLHYNFRINEFKEQVMESQEFSKLTLKKQKQVFIKMLDLNQMWVNVSEMTDKQLGLSEKDIQVTKDFYQFR